MSGEAVLAVLHDWTSTGNGALHVEAHELEEFVGEVMAAVGSDQ